MLRVLSSSPLMQRCLVSVGTFIRTHTYMCVNVHCLERHAHHFARPVILHYMWYFTISCTALPGEHLNCSLCTAHVCVFMHSVWSMISFRFARAFASIYIHESFRFILHVRPPQFLYMNHFVSFCTCARLIHCTWMILSNFARAIRLLFTAHEWSRLILHVQFVSYVLHINDLVWFCTCNSSLIYCTWMISSDFARAIRLLCTAHKWSRLILHTQFVSYLLHMNGLVWFCTCNSSLIYCTWMISSDFARAIRLLFTLQVSMLMNEVISFPHHPAKIFDAGTVLGALLQVCVNVCVWMCVCVCVCVCVQSDCLCFLTN